MVIGVWLQETLRMYPPVGFGQVRQALRDVTLAGKLRIPKGVIVWVPHYGIQNTIHNWEEPNKFVPGALMSSLKYCFEALDSSAGLVGSVWLCLVAASVAIAFACARDTADEVAAEFDPFLCKKLILPF